MNIRLTFLQNDSHRSTKRSGHSALNLIRKRSQRSGCRPSPRWRQVRRRSCLASILLYSKPFFQGTRLRGLRHAVQTEKIQYLKQVGSGRPSAIFEMTCNGHAGAHAVAHGLENFGGPVAGSIEQVSMAWHDFTCSIENMNQKWVELGYSALEVVAMIMVVWFVATTGASFLSISTAWSAAASAPALLIYKRLNKKQRKLPYLATPQVLQDLRGQLIQGNNLPAIRDLLEEVDPEYDNHKIVIEAKEWLEFIDECQAKLFITMRLTDPREKFIQLRQLRQEPRAWDCLPGHHGLKVFLPCFNLTIWLF